MCRQLRGVFAIEVSYRLANQIFKAPDGQLQTQLAADDRQTVAVSGGHNGCNQRQGTEQQDVEDDLAHVPVGDELVDDLLHEDAGHQRNQLDQQKQDGGQGHVTPEARQGLYHRLADGFFFTNAFHCIVSFRFSKGFFLTICADQSGNRFPFFAFIIQCPPRFHHGAPLELFRPKLKRCL